MTELQIIELKKELRTDSRLLSQFLDYRHRTILENIDKYKSELEELSSLPFQTEVNTPREGRGAAFRSRFALLNEDQCYFVLTLMRNNQKTVKAKVALVKAFRDARTQLASRDLARVDGKQIRKLETDSIKQLVEYARANGSKNSEMYYSNVTRMTNKIVGISAGERESLDMMTLNEIKVLETIVSNSISDGLSADMHYKDIYKLAKIRCEAVHGSFKLMLK